jgi:hypothetical protein
MLPPSRPHPVSQPWLPWRTAVVSSAMTLVVCVAASLLLVRLHAGDEPLRPAAFPGPHLRLPSLGLRDAGAAPATGVPDDVAAATITASVALQHSLAGAWGARGQRPAPPTPPLQRLLRKASVTLQQQPAATPAPPFTSRKCVRMEAWGDLCVYKNLCVGGGRLKAVVPDADRTEVSAGECVVCAARCVVCGVRCAPYAVPGWL